MASRFCDIPIAPGIEVFALIAAFNEDPHPDKVNLSVGAYRTNEGKPWVLPVVRQVEAAMSADPTLNHEYLPVAGLTDFRTAAVKLLLGENSEALVNNRVAGVQALGGTGALRLAAEFLKRHLQYDSVLVSNPTWGNHNGIFKAAGFSQINKYRYWDETTRGFNLQGMLDDIRSAPDKTVVILHAVAHNPTGVDPTKDQWKEIATLCKEKGVFVLMDCAYQGFASGDLKEDAWACRYFADQNFEFFCAQSFSKNFGLYNERVGNLCVVAKDAHAKSCVLSQMELIVRVMWSNPSNHGARIVASVLNNQALFQEWSQSVKSMADRILFMRKRLHEILKANGCPGNWNHIINQRGMFTYTGLTEAQSEAMLKKHHIYLMKSGRINMCGLNTSNIEYVAKAIQACVTDTACQQQAKI